MNETAAKWIARARSAATSNKSQEQVQQALSVLERLTADPRFHTPSQETSARRRFEYRGRA